MKSKNYNGFYKTIIEDETIYRQIIEYSVETIVIHAGHKVLYINESGAKFLRGTKEALLGANVLDIFLEDSQPMIIERIHKGMTGTEPAELVEQTIRRLDGTLVDVELYCHPVIFGDQKAIQSIFRDITKRKQSERRLNDKEKLASIGQIAAGIAHEVKNPLTSVKGFLQLLKETQSHPYLDTMEAELNKALDTLQNLLQVAKPDLLEEPIVPIDFCKELTSLMLLFQERLYNVEVELLLTDSNMIILGKKNLFLKAFFNLLKNALEAMNNNGIIRVEHYYEDNMIHIKVSDTGIGIPKNKIKMLGTPFFSSKSDGTGMGLTQVFTTIEDHGGMIRVHSEVGKGTTFHVQLPINVEQKVTD
ncbi:ATP-binding protein [Jeotgalibacillus soli]|uniref:histidine kinase n=1 Tax=Jeotgalibacillus soli TaxID=889306 RepID=A0A0C2VJD8_9BACL|nr:ATP-binding protein [Jeotgalibacillus soli]KIL44601.1 PAS domain S-box protein [Jeotgalibacillus soli]